MNTKPHNTGYSGRYRKQAVSIDSSKSKTSDNNRSLSSVKIKLPPISNDTHKQSIFPNQSLFIKNRLIKVIEEKSKDYETAIKDHLGIKVLSRDSSKSDISPVIKQKVPPVKAKQHKSLDYNINEDLASIELQENKLHSSIKNLDKKKKNKPRFSSRMKAQSTEAEDKEIKLIQDSLNKINLLLNKILKKK